MSRYAYFEDLSADEHSDDEEGSSGESGDDEGARTDTERCILHADIDCFYCQCEQLDRKLDPNRPLAIGQKHIVVTCNYAARAMGVGKLQGRDEAYRTCPHLLVVEGSDLERYRVHARRVYESFRRACQRLRPQSAVCKGSMDEMMADLGAAAVGETANCSSDPIHVHGEHNQAVVLTEDQTGQETVFRTDGSTAATPARLLEGASVALQVRQAILEETGFTTTMGVSCSPLLAKLASGLKKPATVNVLPPALARSLVVAMPLRKIPGIGRSTMKLLEPCLAERHGERGSSPWTCGYVGASLSTCVRSIN